MAGWRLGFVAGNAAVVEGLRRLKSYLDHGVRKPIQLMALTAVEECDDVPRRMAATYQGRRDLLCDGLNAVGWLVARPRGTMFVRARHAGRRARALRACAAAGAHRAGSRGPRAGAWRAGARRPAAVTGPPTGTARTVLGPANLAAVRSEPCRNRHNVLFNDEDLAARELDLFRDAGGTTVVDLTLPDIGRDLAGLARIARRTGLHIVTGCGYYLEETHSPAVAESTIEELAERLVARCSCVNGGAALPDSRAASVLGLRGLTSGSPRCLPGSADDLFE